jgi:hypothetical protein
MATASINPGINRVWISQFDSSSDSESDVSEEERDSELICPRTPSPISTTPESLALPEPARLPPPVPIPISHYIENCKIPFVLPLNKPSRLDEEDGRILHSCCKSSGMGKNFVPMKGILGLPAPKDDKNDGNQDPGSDAEVMTQWVGF